MYIRDKAIKEITRHDELLEVIRKSKVCHVGFVDGDKPYVLAFNFGFDENKIYLHCAKEGHKLNILAKNNNVCVYFDTDHEFFARHEEVACSYRMRYKSVQIMGKAILLNDYEEKVNALKIFMRQYSDRTFEFSKPSVDNVNIICIEIEKMTGRKFEYL
ncbi:MAG TPA: pyridoxamine 5'-phosphate oxidase family protein [Bacteroidales bacterium]|nr:pyridoxamine 5'-phosphate oxidase family protein [Bacteroidales bacterium]HNV95506.1 pyridoxamine 5'-phosphate oxidase family protein [Bacteroidales bacterium]HOU97534.1 pyridoxamine 5'-phosphate oxidase family protein [Bacteroidales bacterium]